SGLQYKGEIDDQYFESDKLEWGGGLNLNRYITSGIDAGLHFTYGSVEAMNSDVNGSFNTANFDAQLGTAMLALRFKLYGSLLKEDAFIGPYIQVGGGGA